MEPQVKIQLPSDKVHFKQFARLELLPLFPSWIKVKVALWAEYIICSGAGENEMFSVFYLSYFARITVLSETWTVFSITVRHLNWQVWMYNWLCVRANIFEFEIYNLFYLHAKCFEFVICVYHISDECAYTF